MTDGDYSWENWARLFCSEERYDDEIDETAIDWRGNRNYRWRYIRQTCSGDVVSDDAEPTLWWAMMTVIVDGEIDTKTGMALLLIGGIDARCRRWCWWKL